MDSGPLEATVARVRKGWANSSQGQMRRLIESNDLARAQQAIEARLPSILTERLKTTTAFVDSWHEGARAVDRRATPVVAIRSGSRWFSDTLRRILSEAAADGETIVRRSDLPVFLVEGRQALDRVAHDVELSLREAGVPAEQVSRWMGKVTRDLEWETIPGPGTPRPHAEVGSYLVALLRVGNRAAAREHDLVVQAVNPRTLVAISTDLQGIENAVRSGNLRFFEALIDDYLERMAPDLAKEAEDEVAEMPWPRMVEESAPPDRKVRASRGHPELLAHYLSAAVAFEMAAQDGELPASHCVEGGEFSVLTGETIGRLVQVLRELEAGTLRNAALSTVAGNAGLDRENLGPVLVQQGARDKTDGFARALIQLAESAIAVGAPLLYVCDGD